MTMENVRNSLGKIRAKTLLTLRPVIRGENGYCDSLTANWRRTPERLNLRPPQRDYCCHRAVAQVF